jgi:endonuclease-3 related protein
LQRERGRDRGLRGAKELKGKDLPHILKEFYKTLYTSLGPQGWWPGRTRFEIIIGAILTQNTNWSNVEKAIKRLKKGRLLNPGRMHGLSIRELSEYIRPAGYFNIKAKRIKAFLNHLFDNYGGSLDWFLKRRTASLRHELLTINGIGPETADSILLYAAGRPVFVIDAYTKRVLTRHGLAGENAGYEDLQRLFMESLKHDAKIFNEYHALIVGVGKEFCKTKDPLCKVCPLNEFLV